MPKIPYFPFYVDDYLSSPRVLRMSDAQRGIYVHLMALAWKHPGCKIPTDRQTIQRMCPRSKWSNIEYVLRECFEVVGDGFANPRLTHEHGKALVKSDRAREAVKCREEKKLQRSNDERTIIERSSYQNQNQIQNHKEPKYTVDRSKKRFVPPSLQNVTDYCQERKNKVDPQKWIDHYTSNGWKVGRNAMKDWKAAVRTWEKNGSNGSKVVDINAGGFMPKTAQDELLYALKNQNNKYMPYLSDEAKKLFYSLNAHWNVLQARVIRGDDIFAPVEVDRKTIAAGE